MRKQSLLYGYVITKSNLCYIDNEIISRYHAITVYIKKKKSMAVLGFRKVVSHPGHVNSKCCIIVNWTCFSFQQTF